MSAEWAADKVERRKVSDLIPYARNSRTHSDEQIAQIAASIKEWGWTVPVLVDEDGGIIAGHGRIMAAQKLGLADVPCMVASGWSEAQKRAYVIADNKLTINSAWDMDMLKLEMQDIDALGFNLELTGFNVDEMTALFDEPEAPKIDAGIEYQEAFSVIVVCDSEADQEQKYSALTEAGYDCKVLVN